MQGTEMYKMKRSKPVAFRWKDDMIAGRGISGEDFGAVRQRSGRQAAGFRPFFASRAAIWRSRILRRAACNAAMTPTYSQEGKVRLAPSISGRPRQHCNSEVFGDSLVNRFGVALGNSSRRVNSRGS